MAFEVLYDTGSVDRLKNPPMFLVIILNDDFTPMEFVVEILVGIFGKSRPEAASLMLDVHEKGSGIAGRYVYDIALTKQAQATLLAGKEGFPLRLTVEEELT